MEHKRSFSDERQWFVMSKTARGCANGDEVDTVAQRPAILP